MISPKFFRSLIGFMLTVAMVLLSIFVWVVESHQEAEQSRLATNIGEIKRLDEVLSSSALLAAATGNAAYEKRYRDNVDALDQLLFETMQQFSTDEARRMLRQTEAANHVLVTLEKQALDAIDGKPNPAAFALLNSPEYVENKRIYTDGIDRSFAEMQRVTDQVIEYVHFALMALAISSIVITALASRFIWKSRMELFAHRKKDEQVDLMRAVIRTFMDVQNNLLNNMVYFRTKAAHSLPFDHREIELIDREIILAKQKLAEIAETDLGEVRDLGGIVVIAACDPTKDKPKRSEQKLAKVA